MPTGRPERAVLSCACREQRDLKAHTTTSVESHQLWGWDLGTKTEALKILCCDFKAQVLSSKNPTALVYSALSLLAGWPCTIHLVSGPLFPHCKVGIVVQYFMDCCEDKMSYRITCKTVTLSAHNKCSLNVKCCYCNYYCV